MADQTENPFANWQSGDLSESELNHAFASTPSTLDLWLAINQLLRAAIIEATFEVADPANAVNHGELAHAAGGLEYLGRFQKELYDRFQAAHSGSEKLL